MMKKLSKRSTPLSPAEIEEFFSPPLDHLKYRLVMLCSLKTKFETNQMPTFQDGICGFEAALVASRMFIQFLGLKITHKPHLSLIEDRSYYTTDGKSDEVKVADLGGCFVSISRDLTRTESDLLAKTHHAASKASAHLTYGSKHGFNPQDLIPAIDLITRLLKSHLYDRVNRSISM